MKRIYHPSQLQVGQVYNRVYLGHNGAYARINGKITFRVLETTPVLKIVELFHQFGDPLQEDLRSQIITISDWCSASEEYEISEPPDEKEWYKKSMVVASLQQGIVQGFIDISVARGYADWCGQCPFIARMGGTPHYGLRAVTTCFRCEDKIPDQPLLQSVFCVWKTWEDLEADFKAAGIGKVRT